jgi:hypothetical protein
MNKNACKSISTAREQHIHPTTLQTKDREESSTKTTFVSDVAR